jgi:hypothetical protein
MERETLMAKLLDLVREGERSQMRRKIEEALASLPLQEACQENAQASFLNDLRILSTWRGPDFIYSRGIAETLRVGEDIFELAYAMKRAMA